MEDKSRIWVREWMNQLRSCNFENSKTTQCLVELNQILKSSVDSHSYQVYCNLLELVILQSSKEWLSSSYSNTLLKEIVSHLPPDTALLCFYSLLNQTKLKERSEVIISLLQFLFQSNIFRKLLMQECSSSAPPSQELWPKIVTFIASLPELTSNKLLSTNNFFHHEKYFIFLGVEIVETIKELVNFLQTEDNDKVINTKFLSLVIGQLGLIGKSEYIFKPLLPAVISHTHKNFVWRRILNKIFYGVSDRCLQPLLLCLFQQSLIPHCMCNILGDLIAKKSKVKFILLRKFLIMKHFKSNNVPENVIGYLNSLPNTGHLLQELLTQLLSVWASASAIKHTSYEQHKYITTSVLICIRYLRNQTLDQKFTNDVTESLMNGMKNHLESSDENMRCLGMIVGEKLTEILKLPAKNNSTLKFDYNNNKEALKLMELSKDVQVPDPEFYSEQEVIYNNIKSEISSINPTQIKDKLSYTTDKQSFMKIVKAKNIPIPNEVKEINEYQQNKLENDQLDSDDNLSDDEDLFAYDLPKEETFSKVAKPMYIRDCMAGLIENKDAESMEIYLNCLNNLINKDNVAAIEISVELCKILLNLQNNYALSNFDVKVKQAITSLLTLNPKQVSSYIVSEFYSEHYNLQQRVVMLDVLVMASGRISGINNQQITDINKVEQEKFKDEEKVSSSSTQLHWKEVLEKRIESKTRRFGKARKTVPEPTPDQFGPVAGYFFFPLMTNYDKRIRTLDLMGTDSIILGRMLYALGTILYSTSNSMICEKMSLSLLEFLIPIRSHIEPFVRRACVFCVSMVAMTSNSMTTTLCDVILDARDWLCDVIEHDDDTQTREAATNTVMLLSSKIKKELNM